MITQVRELRTRAAPRNLLDLRHAREKVHPGSCTRMHFTVTTHICFLTTTTHFCQALHVLDVRGKHAELGEHKTKTVVCPQHHLMLCPWSKQALHPNIKKYRNYKLINNASTSEQAAISCSTPGVTPQASLFRDADLAPQIQKLLKFTFKLPALPSSGPGISFRISVLRPETAKPLVEARPGEDWVWKDRFWSISTRKCKTRQIFIRQLKKTAPVFPFWRALRTLPLPHHHHRLYSSHCLRRGCKPPQWTSSRHWHCQHRKSCMRSNPGSEIQPSTVLLFIRL